MPNSFCGLAAGIPDFRSPETGLYHNLQKYDLPEPQAIFEINFFRQNPKPFFTLAKELFPGNFKPTISHYFIRLLHEKGLVIEESDSDSSTSRPGNKLTDEYSDSELEDGQTDRRAAPGRSYATLEQHQRRKDIYQALTSNMAEIFAFFMRLIELHVQQFREKTQAQDYSAANNERVVQV